MNKHQVERLLVFLGEVTRSDIKELIMKHNLDLDDEEIYTLIVSLYRTINREC